MNIIRDIIAAVVIIFLVLYVDQRGGQAVAPILITGGVLLGGWLMYALIDSIIDRLHAETHRRWGEAKQAHTSAAKLLKDTSTGTVLFYDGETRNDKPFVEIEAKPSEVEMSKEEKDLRFYALDIVNQSIGANKGDGQGVQIISEDKAIGIGHAYWKQATDYMQSKGWIVKDGEHRKPTICRGDITLAIIKTALISR